MTSEKQRIAIAVSCGWTNANSNDEFYWANPDGLYVALPDYPNDLNAIAEARTILTPDQQLQFSIYVGKSATRMLRLNQAAWMDFFLIDATSKIQSEAFLRTIGKWEEAQ